GAGRSTAREAPARRVHPAPRIPRARGRPADRRPLPTRWGSAAGGERRRARRGASTSYRTAYGVPVFATSYSRDLPFGIDGDFQRGPGKGLAGKTTWPMW